MAAKLFSLVSPFAISVFLSAASIFIALGLHGSHDEFQVGDLQKKNEQQQLQLQHGESVKQQLHGDPVKQQVHEVPVKQQHPSITITMPGVQPDQQESYLCISVQINQTDDINIVKFIPQASRHTVHHMLLYGCQVPASHALWNCGEMLSQTILSRYPVGPVCQGRQMILYAWAMDAPEFELPEGVGFTVGARSHLQHLVLQILTFPVSPFSGPLSNFQKEPESSYFTLADGFVLVQRVYILSETSSFGMTLAFYFLWETEKFESVCAMKENVELHPFAFRVHTHRLGKVVAGYAISNGRWSLIGKRNPQEPQMFYAVQNKDMIIRQGDILATRCTMENYLDKDVAIGRTSEDEMCNYYIMYWVNGNATLNKDLCGTNGPPFYYWSRDSQLVQTVIPDADASTLPEVV